MGDLQTLRKEAKRLAEESPDYPWVDHNFLRDCRVEWCPSVAEWAHAAIAQDDLCADILSCSMNHADLELTHPARQAYDGAVACLGDGYDLLIASAKEKDVKWPAINRFHTEVPFAQTLDKIKSEEIASLRNPFSHHRAGVAAAWISNRRRGVAPLG